MVQLAANRHTMGKARDLHTGPLQLLGNIVGSGLAIDGRIQREDHLPHAAALYAGDK